MRGEDLLRSRVARIFRERVPRRFELCWCASDSWRHGTRERAFE
jgi:hypothetical protein